MHKSKTTISIAIVVVLIIAGFWWGMGTKNQINSATKTYQDISTELTFKYPNSYSIKEMETSTEDETRTLLLSKEGQAPSIQIAISLFDEDITLTTERIKADVPDLVMKNPETITVNSLASGVKFESDLGINIWFVTKGNLFQLTAFQDESSAIDEIISSLKI